MFKLKKRSEKKFRRIVNQAPRTQAFRYSSMRSESLNNLGRKVDGFGESILSVESKSKGLKKVINLNNLPSLLALGLVLASLAYLLTLNTDPNLVVTNANRPKTQLINVSDLESQISSKLKSSIFYRFKLTFNSSSIEQYLKKTYPEVVEAQVDVGILKHSPRVRVELSEPTVILLAKSGKNYVIDGKGRILTELDNSRHSRKIDTKNLPQIEDQTGVELKVGGIALTVEQMKFVENIKYQTDNANIKTESMAIMPGGFELDVKYSGIDYYVKYNIFNDARRSSGEFLAIVDQIKSKKIGQPSEYIDLRIVSRAYIK